MKKFMIVAACAMLAAVTQAAAVGWSIAGATDYKNGGYDVFVIGMNGVTGIDQIKAIVLADGLAAADSKAFYAGGSVTASGGAILAATASGKSITFNDGGTSADNTYQAFAMIWDADKANASFTSIVSTTLANNSTSKTFTFGSQTANLSSNKFAVAGSDPTPEPTSGLLLLVGGAMLALRRKQRK